MRRESLLRIVWSACAALSMAAMATGAAASPGCDTINSVWGGGVTLTGGAELFEPWPLPELQAGDVITYSATTYDSTNQSNQTSAGAGFAIYRQETPADIVVEQYAYSGAELAISSQHVVPSTHDGYIIYGWSGSSGATLSATVTCTPAAAPPVASSFGYGSIVAYNDGSDQPTLINLSGQVTNDPTSYSVGSSTTAQGGSVSVDSSGQVTYVPPVGYRGATDSFTYRATNAGGTSDPATVTITIGDPAYWAILPSETGVVGAAYNPGGAAVGIEGGMAPYSGFSATGLPSGLSISQAGVISGTPTATGVFPLVITVTDSSSGAGAYTGTANATLTIASAPPTVSNLSPDHGPVAGGETIFITGTNLTGVTSVKFGAQPASIIAVDSATSMRVTAPAGAAGSVNVTATGASGTSATSSANLYTYIATPSPPTIQSSPPLLSNSSSATFTATPAPGTDLIAALGAGGFVGATSPLTYTGLSEGAHTVMFRSSDRGVTSSSTSYTWTIDTTAPAAPAVTAPANGSMSNTTPTISGATETNATVTVYIDGSSVGTTAADGSGAWSFSSVPALAPGSHTVYVTATDGAGNVSANSNVNTFTIAAPTITLSPSSISGATAGAAYSQAFTASGGVASYNYQVSSGALPAGLMLSPGGMLTGVPTAVGAFNFTVTATDSSTGAGPYSGSRAYALTVAAPTIALSPATLPNGTAGAAYAQTVTASGGVAPYAYAVTAGALPAGWTLSTSGLLSGTATSSGVFNFTVTATDSTTGSGAPYSGSRAFSVGVAGPNLNMVAPSGSSTVGDAYSGDFIASGGVAPYTFSVVAGALPPGLTLSPEGTLSGTPSGAGTFNFTVRAIDSTTGTGAPHGVVGNYAFTVANPAAPTAAPANASTAFEAPVAIDLSASVSGVYASLAIAAVPAHGSVSISGDVATYTPASGYFGADSFTYTASGPGGTSAPAAVSVVVGTPAAPTVADVSGVSLVYEGGGQAIDLSSSITGAHSSIAVTSAPAHGAASVSGDVVTYTSAAGYYGSDSFTYAATGPGGTSAPATVTLTVATPPAPVVDEPSPVVVEPSEGAGPTSVDLSAVSSGVVTAFRVETAPSGGQASLEPPAGGSTAWRLVYTPAPNFMGEDVVAVVAEGPGGESAPAEFTFRVRGAAPDLSGVSTDGEALTFEPTTGLVGGPFQGLVIIRQPGIGWAEVVGLTIVYHPQGATPAARVRAASTAPATVGETSMEYAVVLAFGQSEPGVIDIEAVETTPELTPLTASTLAGRPVTVSLTDTATGGPFTGAAVVSISDEAGSAAIREGGAVGARTYDLTFTPAGDFIGQAVVTYTLSNAGGAAQGELIVTVEARPDPSVDPEVRGLISAQIDTARRFTRAQTDNFHRRLEQLRRGGSGGVSNGLSLNLGDNGLTQDPREALRRQLGQRPNGTSPFADEEDAFAARRMGQGPLMAASPTAAPTAPAAEAASGVGVWTAGALDWGRRDADGQRDYRFTTSGLSAGVDMAVSDSVILGAGVGYGHDRTRIGDNGTLSEADNYLGAVYGSWAAAEGVVFDGVVGYGALEYDSRRWSSDEAAYLFGQRSGSVLFGSASVALERVRRNLHWAPYARLSFGSIRLDGFSEAGSDVFALDYDALDTDTLASALGASFDWNLERREGVLAPSVRIEWRHEFEGADDQIVSYADWLASPDYAVGLERWARDSISLSMGVQWRGVSGWTFGADYQGQVGSDLASHGLKFQLLKTF